MCVNVAALIINRIDCVVIKSFAWAEGSHFYVAFLPWPGPASIRAKCVPAFSLFFRRLSFLNWSSLGWQKVIWSVFRNTFADSFLFLLFKVFYFPVCLLMWLNLSFFLHWKDTDMQNYLCLIPELLHIQVSLVPNSAPLVLELGVRFSCSKALFAGVPGEMLRLCLWVDCSTYAPSVSMQLIHPHMVYILCRFPGYCEPLIW